MAVVSSLRSFDREKQKEYLVPIVIKVNIFYYYIVIKVKKFLFYNFKLNITAVVVCPHPVRQTYRHNYIENRS